MKQYPYKKENYIVEVHIDKDVFSHDYGKDEACALRAVERMEKHLDWNHVREIRVWHGGSLISVYDAEFDGEPDDYAHHSA